VEIIGIIGLILAVGVLIIGAYKGLGAFPVTLLASLVVIITNGMSVWAGYSEYYMGGYTGSYMSYLLLFAASSLYAKFMDVSGSATSIGYQFIDWFGRKKVMLVSTLIVSVLTYGGVSLFVVIYAVVPIMYLLFKEANLPRHLMVACLVAGSSTYTMTSLPGTPALTNVIPTQFLGTTLTAAPVMGIVASIATFAMCMVYMNYAEKKAVAAGEVWSFPDNYNASLYMVKDRSLLPAVWKAFLPIIVLLGIILVGSRFGINSTMLAIIAMLVGTLSTYIINLDKFKGQPMKDLVTQGLGGGIAGIGGLAAVVAFGAVVQNSDAFAKIVEWVLSLDLNAYLKAVFSTALVAGITGSSSGGLRIMYTSLAETFINSGANLEVLHRLTSIAASSLDTLPHSPGLFLTLAVLGLNHKNSYRHVFATSVVITSIVTVVLLIISMLFF